MTKEEHIKYWQESAKHDLDSAEEIFNAGRYDWCLFVGNLALEKILKALFVDKNDNNIPPKVHNLVRLAELSKISLTDQQKFFLDKINDFNIQARYPDYKFQFYKTCDENFAKENLAQIKELFSWFNSRIKLKA
jgi:HEPN domain-containing protein